MLKLAFSMILGLWPAVMFMVVIGIFAVKEAIDEAKVD